MTDAINRISIRFQCENGSEIGELLPFPVVVLKFG